MTLSGLVLAIFVALITDEIFSWVPSLFRWIIRRNSKTLPPELADRYQEEWYAHLNEIPGRLGKLLFAIDTVRAAHKLAHQCTLPRVSRLQFLGVRFFDVAMCVMLLVMQLPLLIAVAISLFIENGGHGPILCRLPYVGLYGRRFNALKFRTFRLKPTGVDIGSADPRVSLIGKYLRRFGIDELPQLINVIKGDMSLVGPQAQRPGYFDYLQTEIPNIGKRNFVRPGLTGFAQLYAPYEGPLDNPKEKLKYDLYFIEHFSVKLVLGILYRTVVLVSFGRR